MNNHPAAQTSDSDGVTSIRAKDDRQRHTTPTRSTAPRTPKRSAKTKTLGPSRALQTNSNSKSDAILALLRRKNGASIAELQKSSGWQPHSVRGFLSGMVKTKLGLDLRSERMEKGERRYVVKKP